MAGPSVCSWMLGVAGLVFLAQPTLAQDNEFKVVTTFTIIADMARNVAGDAAVVESITKAGAEIHGYEPTPGDIIRAQDADLILWNGLNLELWFEQFFTNLQDVPSATLSDGIVPMSIAEGEYSGKPNPHAWMSLESAVIYVDNIRDAMSEHDPQNAATYAANAEAYKAEITAAIAPLRAAVLGLVRRRVQLSHPRFPDEGTVSVADQRRRPGHAAAGSQSDRRSAGKQHSGDILRKYR
jgi:manganese/iron transport system substrate-binding protein